MSSFFDTFSEIAQNAIESTKSDAVTYASDFFKRSMGMQTVSPQPAQTQAPPTPVSPAAVPVSAPIMQVASNNSFYLILVGIGILFIFLFRGK